MIPQKRKFSWVRFRIAGFKADSEIIGRFKIVQKFENFNYLGISFETSQQYFHIWKFLECGIHAREWVSPASCRYMINQVLSANADPDFPVKDSLPYNADDLRGLLDFNW